VVPLLYPELRRIARQHLRRNQAGQTLESAALANEDAKRGGDAVRVPIDDVLLVAPDRGIGLLSLDEALDLLSRIDARKGRVVELRYFGGLMVEETAEVLRISPETVKRDWRMA
jgi:RNA polymerase sigma-70 factor (ECF subfamily)